VFWWFARQDPARCSVQYPGYPSYPGYPILSPPAQNQLAEQEGLINLFSSYELWLQFKVKIYEELTGKW